ncbi:hypothetical protein C0J52_25309 [Blattella germanica]|nr:hypothetical protein C0J52_25309 [Blattella germanica]
MPAANHKLVARLFSEKYDTILVLRLSNFITRSYLINIHPFSLTLRRDQEDRKNMTTTSEEISKSAKMIQRAFQACSATATRYSATTRNALQR